MRTVLSIFLLLAACAPVTVTPTESPTVIPPSVTPSVVPPSDAPFLPNPATQPGWPNPDVTQANVRQTICTPGYSSSIRPPVTYTEPIKISQIVEYGYVDKNPADYEEDHLIALEDGGDPRDVRNLWPQPRNSQPWNAGVKDTLENTLHDLICSGKLGLDEARQALAIDWVAAYRKYVSPTVLPVTPGIPEP